MEDAAQKNYYQLGYGGLGMFFAGVVLAAALFVFIFPSKFHKPLFTDKTAGGFCRPYINDDGTFKKDAPEIQAPEYDANTVRRGQPFPTMHASTMVTYRLIKSSIPIKGTSLTHSFSTNYLQNATPNQMHCEMFEFNGNHHAHFCQWIHEPLQVTPNISGAEKYVVLYPAPYSDGNTTDRYIGASDPYASEVEADTVFRYGTYQILFLLQLDKDNKTILAGKDADGIPYFLADVYQQVKPDDDDLPITPLPPNVLTCKDGVNDKQELQLGDVMESSPDKKQEQLGWFVPVQMVLSDNWYSPACKPAINLYPEKDTFVNVKVDIPHGFLTYTDPLYPVNQGWNVIAHPNGNLQYLSKNLANSKGIVNYPTGMFPYLYYEGKIQDQFITKPDTGFVRAYNQLPTFFDELLPKLGLNEKESAEFKAYWLKALPNSPYYFIGIIPQEQINQNEPLTITPKQQTLIRVRLYFEALDHPQLMQAPTMQTPTRSGFTVVDWGGMVKQDKNHPFTCLQ